MDIYIKCAEAYLEDEAAVEAEVFMNKASPSMNNISTWTLQLRYKATLARVLDANRKVGTVCVCTFVWTSVRVICECVCRYVY
ncbi:hypothetical protein EON65_29155 [archaeon]|nr:MAG: hypothetical protein EON65_29155 [archaeon]